MANTISPSTDAVPGDQHNGPGDTGASLESQSLDWLAHYGDDLYSYALKRVQSAELAEDLVQDTFLAAIGSAHRFANNASPKTWLISILRHKLVDHYRQKATRDSLADVESNPEKQQSVPPNAPHPSWISPDARLRHQEFHRVLRECIEHLPDLIRQAFEFRFFDELPHDEVCRLQGVSSNNLAARMYRARKYLRSCLTQRWG